MATCFLSGECVKEASHLCRFGILNVYIMGQQLPLINHFDDKENTRLVSESKEEKPTLVFLP